MMPCAGPVDPRVLQSAIAIVSSASSSGITVCPIGITDRTLVHTARNILAEGLLASDAEWGFWMDSDMILEPRTISVMLGWAKKLKALFLTGIYVQRQGKHRPLILRRDPIMIDGKPFERMYGDEYAANYCLPKNGTKTPFKVHTAGFGCILTHRSVFELLPKPWFRHVWLQEGKEASEDFYFCVQARNSSIDLWCVPELRCGHMGDSPVFHLEDFTYDPKDMAEVRLETVKIIQGEDHGNNGNVGCI